MTPVFQRVPKPKAPVAAAPRRGLAVSGPSDHHEREADRLAAPTAKQAPAHTRASTGAGGALPPSLAGFFGAKLGYSFANVRVHHDADADVATRGLAASAFTVGNDIYFRAGRYAPETDHGLALLAHELVHVRQQSLAGPRIDRKIFSKEELEEMNPPSTMPGILGSDPAFDKFAELLRSGYRVRTVRRGTFNEQAAEVASAHVNPGVTRGTIDPAAWTQWRPPSGWATYKNILSAIDSFARSLGGLPEIQEVILFDVRYDVDERTGVVRADPLTGASFGHGQLTLYRAITQGDPLPAGRSGQRPAALVSAASEREAVGHSITHELGHGVAEKASLAESPPTKFFDDFRREVGWTSYQPAAASNPAVPERLFDAGVAEVRDALRAGNQPPAQYQITDANWNDGRWIEQPISRYAATSASDDFAESVSAFVRMPEILKQRSPRRYKFIESRKDQWFPQKKAPPPAVGATPPATINPP